MLATLARLFRFWGNLSGAIDRRTYVVNGIALAALKYAGDVALVQWATGTLWTPGDYLSSVSSVTNRLSNTPGSLLLALGAWTLPFLWLGVSLTLRRALDAGMSCWWTFVFFVPYANYALMALLSLLPTYARGTETARATAPDGRKLSAAIVSVTAGVGLGLLAFTVITLAKSPYTPALFFGTPFAMGVFTSFLFNRQYDASDSETRGVTLLAFLVLAGVVFLLATEGAVCILMALPLVVLAGMGGAVIGKEIAERGQRRLPPAFTALLLLPLAAALEPGTSGRIVHEVRSAVEIDAAPADVWRHVVAFTPIPEPREPLFRLGIAYPQYARIDGQGVGAVRYCVFSTGAFVEPITVWDEGRRLSFDVIASPPPLRELTLYSEVSPPHLDGFLRSKRGEFRFVALPGGRTLLEGSTWYELEMAPEGYWQVFSDYLIHRIHLRVLDHIKQEAERPRATASGPEPAALP